MSHNSNFKRTGNVRFSAKARLTIALVTAACFTCTNLSAEERFFSGELTSSLSRADFPVGLVPVLPPLIPVIQKFPLNEAFCDITQHPTTAPSGGIEFAGPSAGRPGNGEIQAWSPASGRPLVAYPLTDYPDAVCNDGSPARLYVRPAPATIGGQVNPHINKWHVHLKGGGSCRDWRSCAERWCDAPVVNPATGALTPKQLNDPGLMSSTGMPEWAAVHGIFRDKPFNRFAAYNQVLVAYCSSDSWIGNHGAADVVSLDPLDDGKKAMIEFRGKVIVDAVFDVLSKPAGLSFTSSNPNWDSEVSIALPSLRDARQLLVSGDSAGANGARQHIDRIRTDLHALTAPNKPLVISALDAGGAPKLDDPLIDWTVLPGGTNYSDFMLERFDQSIAFHGVASDAIDESCTSINGFDPLCIDTTFVEQNHITTPLFQRTSLRDVLTKKSLVDTGMLASPAELRATTRSGLADLTVAGTEPRRPISVVGPDDTQHVTFGSLPFYTLTTASGLSAAQHLRFWVTQCELGSCNSGAGLINDVD